MEIKATLNKPYTNEQRMDFIVENNHNNGYEIKETETALEAWGYTEKEIQEQDKQNQINDLIRQLNEIDLKTVRPLRAIQSGQGAEDDQQMLNEFEERAEIIRQQIRDLQNNEESAEQIMEENNAQ